VFSRKSKIRSVANGIVQANFAGIHRVLRNRIDRVKAIVLGGSYATGMASDSSDLDIGIYYSDLCPLSLSITLSSKFCLCFGKFITLIGQAEGRKLQ